MCTKLNTVFHFFVSFVKKLSVPFVVKGFLIFAMSALI